MTALGYFALALALCCMAVLACDLWRGRTAFAQFSTRRHQRPLPFWFGIAGWLGCIAGCLLVALADHGRQVCGERNPCTLTIEIAE